MTKPMDPSVPTPSRASHPEQEARSRFRERFGLPAVHLVRCPQAVELLGNQSLDADGLGLAMAVDRYVVMAVAPRSDGKVHLCLPGRDKEEVISISDQPNESGHGLAAVVQAVLNHLFRRGVHARGFSAVLRGDHSTVHDGAASAAWSVAAALAYRELQPFALTETGCTVPPVRDRRGRLPPPGKRERLEIARLCQAVTTQVLDSPLAWQDSMASLFGQAFHAVEFDGQSLAVEPVPLAGEVAWIWCSSGTETAEPSEDAARWRIAAEEAAIAMGVRSLRAADPDRLQWFRDQLTGPRKACAAHAVEEVRRVLFGSRALRDGDFEQFGQYLFQSHESRRDRLRDVAPELELLVDLARLHPGCLGARACPGGGASPSGTLNLVRLDQAESFMRALDSVYEKRTGRAARSRVRRPVDGAGPV